MEFRTAYTKEKSKPTASGNKEIKKYTVRLTKAGTKVLVEDGKLDIYELTQAGKEEADIHTILDRAKNGDVKSIEILQKGQNAKGNGSIQDLTTAPKNLIEAQQKLIDAERTWNALDSDLKSKFNNSMTEFLAGVEDGRVQSYIDSKKPKVETKVATETTKKEEVL